MTSRVHNNQHDPHLKLDSIRRLLTVLLHCSTSKPVPNVVLKSPEGYQMYRGLVWVRNCMAPLKTTADCLKS